MFDWTAPRVWDRASDGEGPEPLREDELAYLISFAKRALWAPPEVRRRIQEAGVNITPATFYSDVPLVDEVVGSFEYRGDSPPYPDLFDLDRMRAALEVLLPYSEEFDPPLDGDLAAPVEYFWRNPAFSYNDAMTYWCVLRHVQPDHVVEIGSGYSTLVADAALRANGGGSLTIVEPYPKDFLRDLPTVRRLVEQPVQDLPVGELVGLVDAADVLFIDSTHTVKIGSDCLYLYLTLLPRLSEPVLAHSHDIYLPFAVPQDHALERHVYWTEQYLLAALLLNDPGASVLYGSKYGKVYLPTELRAMMHGRQDTGGGSLWYGLNGAGL